MKILLAFLILILTGCSAQPVESPQPDMKTPESGVYNDSPKKFVGVVGAQLIENSSVAVNSSYRVTTKENQSLVTQSIVHPVCDVVAFQNPSETSPSIGTVSLGESLFLTDDAKFTGSGSLLGRAGGTFHHGDCVYRVVKSVFISGIPGSGVYNSSGELIGMSVGERFKEDWPGKGTVENKTVILEFRSIKHWLTEL